MTILSPKTLLLVVFRSSASRRNFRFSPSASAVKAEFVRSKPHFNVGTIGHVDHGKTSLTSAITKVLSHYRLATFAPHDKIDNCPEEKLRGITIAARHVEYETSDRHYSHVDCPGHADFVKNMITGSFVADGCVLVLAADAGVMPQTREHMILVRQIGLTKMVVFLNKADLVDESTIRLCEEEIREMLGDHGFDGERTPVVVGSAKAALEEEEEEEDDDDDNDDNGGKDGIVENRKLKTSLGSANDGLASDNNNDDHNITLDDHVENKQISENADDDRSLRLSHHRRRRRRLGKASVLDLLSTMDSYFDLPPRRDDLPCLLPISDRYSIVGRGTVVAGILERGVVRKGDSVEISGFDLVFKTTVANVETFHKTLTSPEPGDNIGVLVRGVKRGQLRRGMVLAKAGSVRLVNRVKARVYLLESDEGGLDEPLCQDHEFRLYSRTFYATANVNRVLWSDGECGGGDGGGGESGVGGDAERQMVMPGEETAMELMLTRKWHFPVGTRFTLRSKTLTIGYGVVTEVLNDADEAMLKKRWRKWKTASKR